jgi:hypothetical protein
MLTKEQRQEFGREPTEPAKHTAGPAPESILEVSTDAKPSQATRGFTAGPWELVEGSDDGNAVISPPMDTPLGSGPWWTAIVLCAHTETQNRVARLMAAAPDLLEVARLVLVFNEGNPHPEDEDSWCWFAKGLVDKARAAIAKATP